MGKKARPPYSAKASLADMALSALEATLASNGPSIRDLVRAVGPAELAQWDAEIFRELDTTRCNQALQALRNRKFPRGKYRALADAFKRGIREVQDCIPARWPLWAPIFRKYKTHADLG